MAYIVRRPQGRFEIRESVRTPQGPRARSLANFSRLTDDIIALAAARATRPFDAAAVLEAGRRAGAPAVGAGTGTASPTMIRFVEASHRMARSVDRAGAPHRQDPGQALIDLLGFAEQVTAFRPAPPVEPLRFPVLFRLVAARPSARDQKRR